MIGSFKALLEGEHFFLQYLPFELAIVKDATVHCQQVQVFV